MFLVIAAALLLRLKPLLGMGDDLRAAITEDGYLMLTVARNLGIGNGLTVSEGEIWTNGIQPLATIFYALPYFALGENKAFGIAGVVLIMTVISLVATYLVYALARRLLPGESDLVPLAAATLWASSPLLFGHSMNGLETGLYTAFILATLIYLHDRIAAHRVMTLAESFGLGALCGLTFLARNDGAILVAVLLITRFLHVQLVDRATLGAAFKEGFVAGIVSLLFASPWLAYNVSIFGSIMPISGYAQSLTAEFAGNIALIPAKLFEMMVPIAPIPGSLETSALVIGICLAALLTVLAAFIALQSQRPASAKVVMLVYLLFTLGLAAHYGLNFGAPWFLSRYLAPTAPILIIASTSVLWWVLSRLTSQRLGAGALATMAAAGLALTVYKGYSGKQHGHMQVVDWVQDNVPAETWVGAVQTGTLGYWHDRTINLDGKVNPAALRAIMSEGSVLAYVTASEIDILADWHGITGWLEHSNADFTAAFELVLVDETANLGVLRRRDRRSE